MVKSNSERQREFRAKAKGKFRKLEVLLPCNEFNLLHGNAKELGLTKANYVVSLLHDNELLAANVKLTKVNDELRTKNIAQGKVIRELDGKIKELEDSTLIDKGTIDRLSLKESANKPNPAKANSNLHHYDGSAKEFKTKLVSILGGDNNVVSAERKKAYAALNIAPKANGQLESDADRLAVYEWLLVNKK